MDGEEIINQYKAQNPKSRILYNNQYTKKFIKYNRDLLKSGATQKIVFDDNLIYNQLTNRFIKKSNYYTIKGGVRKKYNNSDFVIDEDTFFRPSQYIKTKINPKIRRAEQTQKATEIYINQHLLNDNLSLFLNTLRPTNLIYQLRTADNQFFVLNSATIQRLKEALKPDMVQEEYWESGVYILTAWKEYKDLYLTIRPRIKKKGVIDGAFFRYTHKFKAYVDLSAYGVYPVVNHENYEINCLCKAFETAGHDITALKSLVKNSEIPMRH